MNLQTVPKQSFNKSIKSIPSQKKINVQPWTQEENYLTSGSETCSKSVKKISILAIDRML